MRDILKGSKTLYLILLSCCVSHAARFEVEKSVVGTSARDFLAVAAIDANQIWLGVQGNVYRTTDGGENWTVHSIGNSLPSDSLHFLDSNTGFFHTRSYVMRTDDGGITWEYITDFVDGREPLDFFVLDQNNIWVLYQQMLYRSVDGGNSWIEVLQVQGLGPIQFFNQDFGYSLWAGNFISTLDGGSNWDAVANLGFVEFNDMFFLTEQKGFAITDNGAVMGTVNGGSNWTAFQLAEEGEKLRQIHFTSDAVGTIIGDRIYQTADGGATWTPKTELGQATLRRMQFIDSQNGYAVGENGALARTTDGGSNWTIEHVGLPQGVVDVEFADGVNGWVTFDGNIARTTDGGNRWYQESLPNREGRGVESVVSLPDGSAWAVGEGGKAWSRGSNVNAWDILDTGVTSDLSSVFFLNESMGWALGPDGTLIRTENGGVQWETLNVESDLELWGIMFFDSDIGWIIGDETLLRSENGGDTWASVSADKHYVSFWFNIVGPENALQHYRYVDPESLEFIIETYRTTDGGATWNLQENNDFSFGAKYWFANNCFGIRLNDEYSMTRTGGQSWTVFESGLSDMSPSDLVRDEFAFIASTALTKLSITAEEEVVVGTFESNVRSSYPMVISFDSEIGKDYIVEYSSDLVEWESFCDRITATISITKWTENRWNMETDGFAPRYYRVLKVEN